MHSPLCGFSQFYTSSNTSWQPCHILSFDQITKHFTIEWTADPSITKQVTRVNLRYDFEDAIYYEQRIEKAKERRKVHEALVRYTGKLKEAQEKGLNPKSEATQVTFQKKKLRRILHLTHRGKAES